MTSGNSETGRRYRKRHPDRAALTRRISSARTRAAIEVARRYPREWEAAIRKNCREEGIPRFLPALDPAKDGRVVR